VDRRQQAHLVGDDRTRLGDHLPPSGQVAAEQLRHRAHGQRMQAIVVVDTDVSGAGGIEVADYLHCENTPIPDRPCSWRRSASSLTSTPYPGVSVSATKPSLTTGPPVA